MYTFLCQVEKRIEFDFVLETLNAIDYANWYNNEEVYKGITSFSTRNLIGLNNKIIPVGSIEFVQDLYRLIGVNETLLKPTNIPIELLKYANRKLWYGTELDTNKLEGSVFCKSNDKLKGYTGLVDNDTKLEKGNYMFSELIEIDSEWRCFVLKGELLAIHNYSNSLGLYPDISKIKEMISNFSDLEAYTLDIGVSKRLGTFIIEIHDFYSCGLYGYRDYNKILQMLITSHNQKMIKNKKIK